MDAGRGPLWVVWEGVGDGLILKLAMSWDRTS